MKGPFEYLIDRFPFSPGAYNGPKGKQTQCFCKVLEDKQRELWCNIWKWPIGAEAEMGERVDEKEKKIFTLDMQHALEDNSLDNNYCFL